MARSNLDQFPMAYFSLVEHVFKVGSVSRPYDDRNHARSVQTSYGAFVRVLRKVYQDELRLTGTSPREDVYLKATAIGTELKEGENGKWILTFCLRDNTNMAKEIGRFINEEPSS